LTPCHSDDARNVVKEAEAALLKSVFQPCLCQVKQSVFETLVQLYKTGIFTNQTAAALHASQ